MRYNTTAACTLGLFQNLPFWRTEWGLYAYHCISTWYGVFIGDASFYVVITMLLLCNHYPFTVQKHNDYTVNKAFLLGFPNLPFRLHISLHDSEGFSWRKYRFYITSDSSFSFSSKRPPPTASGLGSKIHGYHWEHGWVFSRILCLRGRGKVCMLSHFVVLSVVDTGQ